MTATRVIGAGFSHLGGRARQEDRWAVAEVGGAALGAVADGMSDPLGLGRSTVTSSGAIAELAVSTFVEVASRRLEAQASPDDAVRAGFEAAARAAHHLDATGGAAFVGACLAADGTLSLIKAGDCRAFADFGGGRFERATTEDDADRSGALTSYIGNDVPHAPVIVRQGCRSLVLASDGVWRDVFGRGAATPSATPFVLAREIVTQARRAGETDNLAAVVLALTPYAAPARSLERVLAPAFLAVGAVLFFVAGLLAATLVGGAP